MTRISRLLKKIQELDAEDTPLHQQGTKDGYRLVSGDDIVWFTCADDAKRRYRGGILKTDGGVIRITNVTPVDDGSHNCNFCGAQLTPPEEADQSRANMDSMGMQGMAGPNDQPGVGVGGMF